MTWAFSIPAAHLPALGPLRTQEAVSVLCEHGLLWVKGADLPPEIDTAIRVLPEVTRYESLPGDRLRRTGARVPERALPQGSWTPIREILPLDPQPAGLAGRAPDRVPLLLVRGNAETESTLLAPDPHDWHRFAVSAPLFRLEPLDFAACMGAVLVRGVPLPPIRGERFTVASGVAVPSGFTLDPPVSREVVRGVLGLLPGELGVLRASGAFLRVAGSSFVPATRAAVRLTLAPILSSRPRGKG